MKRLFSILPLAFGITAIAQIQIDKPIQLTGSGADARVSGIQQVSASGDAVSASAIQQGSLQYAPAGGTANAIDVTLSPPVASYSAGMMVHFRAAAGNTGAVTLNVNGLGVRDVRKSVSQPLASGDISTGQMVSVIYDGTAFQVLSPLGGSGACAAPSAPGAITGAPAAVPNATGITYSVQSYTGVFSYEWSVPAGATITSGQGYNSIVVDFGANSGAVSVVARNHCGASAASTLNVSINQPKVVFVSGSAYASNYTPAQRDAACQADATSAGLSGTYKAWVSNGASNNVPSTTGFLYRRPDGSIVAYDWADLTDGTLLAAINRTAANASVADTVFTGLTSTGTVASNTCSGWTSTSNAVTGAYGLTSATSSAWTASGNKACASAPIPTMLGWVGDPNYYPALGICQNCYGGTYLNGTQFGNFNNVPYTLACAIIPTWNSVNCARCYKDVVTQKSYRHYCVQQ